MFTNDFSEEIYNLTYKVGEDKNIEDTLQRIAKALSSVEKEEKKEYWQEQFFNVLKDFKFVPGGRIISNSGGDFGGTTLINCFVSGFRGENQDSMNSIQDELKRQAQILKSEGGYGINFSTIRYRGAYIKSIGSDSPGVVTMMDMWNTQSRVITEGSGQKNKNEKGKKKIRKGAMMGVLTCFSKNTEILTEFGWLSIIEVIELLEQREDLNVVIKDGSLKKAFNPIKRENSEIFEIETEDGEIIQTTLDHKFQVRNIKTNEIYLKELGNINDDEEIMIIKL